MTEVETRVCEIVGDDLHLGCVHLADDLIHDHGVDELGLMSVAMRLEEEFHLGDRSVSEEALIGESTVGKCVELVSRAMCLAPMVRQRSSYRVLDSEWFQRRSSYSLSSELAAVSAPSSD